MRKVIKKASGHQPETISVGFIEIDLQTEEIWIKIIGV